MYNESLILPSINGSLADFPSASLFFQEACDECLNEQGYDATVEAAFKVLDKYNIGTIRRTECEALMKAAVARLHLDLGDDVVNAAMDTLLEEAGGDSSSDQVSKSLFAKIFRENPDLLAVFRGRQSTGSLRDSQANEAAVELENKELEAFDAHFETWDRFRNRSKDSMVILLWMFLYVAANVAAFTYETWLYMTERKEAVELFGSCIAVARGSALAINLNAALILIPINRHLQTALRATPLRFVLPFDTPIETHIVFAIGFTLFSLVHVGAHICNYIRFADGDGELVQLLLGPRIDNPDTKQGRVRFLMSSDASITGILMVLLMVVAYAFVPLRRSAFNSFWYSHHVLIAVLILLCIHGAGHLAEKPKSWMWVVGPLSLYLIPKIGRESCCTGVETVRAIVKDGGVVCLQMAKPKLWQGYVKAGMYVVINIPSVSKLEWHPFTLTSAPADDFIEIHFRKMGDWTEKAYDIYSELCQQTDEDMHIGAKQIGRKIDFPRVKIDGPIGASSQEFSQYPVVVLIGAGIGATPMISVLKHLLVSPGKMKRAYFYWTVRDRVSFSWFRELMDDIYESDKENRLQIREFLTSARDDDRDLGAVLLHHATRAIHKKTNVDLVLGYRSHCQVQVGRPNWRKELSSIRVESTALGFRQCGVFLCGPDSIAQSIREAKKEQLHENAAFHFHFSKETF